MLRILHDYIATVLRLGAIRSSGEFCVLLCTRYAYLDRTAHPQVGLIFDQRKDVSVFESENGDEQTTDNLLRYL